MDKIAQQIFAPLLAGMSGTTQAKAVQQYRNVQALQTHTTIRVEKLEVTLPRDHTCHPEVVRTGYVDDSTLEDAIRILRERHADELYDIACSIIEAR
jgi:hypothetical protein